MLPDPLTPLATVLVVDDEEFLLQYVRVVLERAGYVVLTAENGEEAWNLVVANRESIRLVLTDIVMPGSFDGIELAERVRKHWPDLPVLLMTGNPLHTNPPKDRPTSQRALLRKPFVPEELLAIVRGNIQSAKKSV
jgi:CheY-like chemotaxis protein